MLEPVVLFALECKGWCSALSAGGTPEARGFWTYSIECSDLTEEGEGLRTHTTSSPSTRVLPITTHTTSSPSTRVLPITTHTSSSPSTSSPSTWILPITTHTGTHTCSGHHICQPHALSPLRLIRTVHCTVTFPHAHVGMYVCTHVCTHVYTYMYTL